MGNNNLISSKKTYYISIAILAGMFFIFGFVSWVNAILIPYFRISCELTHFESYFVAFAFYIAYFVMAIPSGVLLKKVGFKRGIMYGFMLTALGAFLFVPAALARQFEIFLAGLFSIGTGLAILQLPLILMSLLSVLLIVPPNESVLWEYAINSQVSSHPHICCIDIKCYRQGAFCHYRIGDFRHSHKECYA